jgi:N-acylglucosamine-6-phosphate 2-epimerase
VSAAHVADLLDTLCGGLIFSVQLPRDSALGEASAIASLAEAAVAAGAAGVRIESIPNLEAVRARLDVPVIGIIKREYEGYEPYITPTLREVSEIAATGVDIVAFDATRRARPDASATERIVSAIWRGGALAMADCALGEDGRVARGAGADVLATTLCGYTDKTRGAELPALWLTRELATFAAFTICEGGIAKPESGSAALAAGADAIVVGTAITRALDVATAEETVAQRTRAFAAALAS